MDRLHPPTQIVTRLAAHLSRGRIVVAPTETRYALLADATSARAVESVRRIKGRSQGQPFSVFVLDATWLKEWGIRLTPMARPLAASLWPGPITLILPTRNRRFAPLGGRRGSIGIRVTPEPVVRRLLARLDRPLIATSANPSGRDLPATAENRWLNGLVAQSGVLWARPKRYVRRNASTIVDCTGSRARQLRAGPIVAELRQPAAIDGGVT